MSEFDPNCLFLLDLLPINLFEPTGVPHKLRCKGCGSTVKTWEHEGHFNRHKGAQERSAEARKRHADEERRKNLAKARAAKRS